ncbi:trehalose phosphate synthase [Pseudozyma hubeiensis SY62]|uniref:Trehalose phosphate synthase n=1 Tax=Pseudozyma hubeiensis (strain SY62) TaxID=1305764 RepID=R9PDG4_PSEHS|nr:trehalose phosphate synthase [Pseudozyma hubeiensis SY62]GAC96145.1 trehalose phosphate synthase [Pseudozyma hubeiensis SY62]
MLHRDWCRSGISSSDGASVEKDVQGCWDHSREANRGQKCFNATRPDEGIYDRRVPASFQKKKEATTWLHGRNSTTAPRKRTCERQRFGRPLFCSTHKADKTTSNHWRRLRNMVCSFC